MLKVHKQNIFFYFFCRNRNLIVPRACNTRFLKPYSIRPRYSTFKISAYAQPAMKSIPRMLSQRWNSFHVCSAWAWSIFENYSKIPKMQMQILTINNQNSEKPSRNPSNRTKVKILKKFCLIAHQKHLVPRMLSHHENVRTSKFWQKSKEKYRNFFRKFTKGI